MGACVAWLEAGQEARQEGFPLPMPKMPSAIIEGPLILDSVDSILKQREKKLLSLQVCCKVSET